MLEKTFQKHAKQLKTHLRSKHLTWRCKLLLARDCYCSSIQVHFFDSFDCETNVL